MPFLRFTRDKRGYESTFLVHTARRRGKVRPQILYWFRTPPDVKVGRAALDEEAIRSIEENNPDVTFDWAKILEVQPAPAPREQDSGPRRGRRPAAARREPAGEKREPAAAQPSEPMPGRRREPRTRTRIGPAPAPAAPPVEDRAIVQAIEAVVEPPVIVEPAPVSERVHPPIDLAIGREPAAKLRARFAELLARISERGGDAARIDALRVQAESLNPDTWVTAEEARTGLAEFETRLQELRAALGLRKRRRSRRGGVRRRRRRPDQAAQGPAVVALQSGMPAADRPADVSGVADAAVSPDTDEGDWTAGPDGESEDSDDPGDAD